jgi:hypothetical protein
MLASEKVESPGVRGERVEDSDSVGESTNGEKKHAGVRGNGAGGEGASVCCVWGAVTTLRKGRGGASGAERVKFEGVRERGCPKEEAGREGVTIMMFPKQGVYVHKGGYMRVCEGMRLSE